MVVLDRKTLFNRGIMQGSGGGKLLKYIYVEEYNHVLVSTDSIRYSQVFIFSLDTLLQIIAMKSQNTQNDLTGAIDIIFDKYMNILIYLDTVGNIYFIEYQGTYYQQNILTIREFHTSTNPVPLGLRLNTQTNQLLIFSKNRVYMSNYSQFSNSFKKYSMRLNNFFASIRRTNQITQQEEEIQIILGPQNTLYIYIEQRFSYFTYISNTEQIKDINYNSDKKLFLVAFQNSIYIYDFTNILNNLEIEIQTIQPKQENRYKFQQFLTEDVFQTSDQKIIHFNFQSQTSLNEIVLNKYQRITAKNFISSLNILILGFNDGTILIYDISSKQQQSFSLSNKSNYDDIHFIQETENYIWISSLNCMVVPVDKKTKQFQQKIDLSKFVEVNFNQIGVISVDEQNKRIFMSFFQEKKVRCINLADQSLIKYLSFPDSQYKRIQITSTQLILYSTFQLNIHDRVTLQLLATIRRQNLQDQIISLLTFDDKYYCILSLNKFEVFQIDQQFNVILLDQIIVNSLKVIKTNFDKTNFLLRVIAVSKNQLFDQTYNLRNYQLQKTLGLKQCSLEIKDQTYIEMQKSINQIKPIKNQLPTLLSLIELPNTSTNIFYTVYIDNDLKEINTYLTFDGQITISPKKDIKRSLQQNNDEQYSQLKIYEQTFLNYPKKEIIIKNFNFVFENKQQNIKLNTLTKKIYLQDINISYQSLTNFQFLIENQNSVIIMNLTLKNLTFSYTDTSLSFMKFVNCQTIKIVNLKLQYVIIENFINSFLDIIDSQNVIIDQIEISENQIGSVLQLTNVQNIVIKNIQINNCKILQTQYLEIFDSLFMIKIQGSENLNLSNIKMKNNKNIKFLYSTNKFEKDSIEVTLKTDKVLIENAEFDKNIIDYSNNTQNIILYSNIVDFRKLTFTNNNQNIKILMSQSIQISDSVFSHNVNVNGGALSFIGIQKQIMINISSFYGNQALGSGGAIYCNELSGNMMIDSLSNINDNRALIGGGIRIHNIENDMSNQKIKDILKNVQISGNQADLYGQQYATFLQDLQITSIMSNSDSLSLSLEEFQFKKENELDKDEMNLYSGKLIIKSIRSGSLLKIVFQALDPNGDFIKFSLNKLKINEYPLEIQQELLSYYFQIENQNKKDILLNGETLISADSYDSQINQFNFKEVQISSFPQKQLNLQINYMLNYKKAKPILIDIQFRNCQIGEMIKFLSENIINCQFCQEGSYSQKEPSLQEYESSDPNTKIDYHIIEENSLCQKCPESAEKCSGYEVFLKNGYWRSNKNSSDIIYCENNPSNCKQQDLNSIDGCVEGTLGPLCEECDTFGMNWHDKMFARSFKSNFECSECSSTAVQVTFIISFSLFLILYSLMSTFIFMGSFKYIQMCYYLRILSILPVSYSSMRDQSSLYLKILLNYFQLSSILIYFNVQIIPEVLTQTFSIIMNPVEKITVTADCLISQIVSSRLDRIHAIQIGFVVFPIIYLIILIAILKILEHFKMFSVKNNHVYTLINFMFVFFQPSQISFFTKSLICRQIGLKKYVDVDLLIECKDPDYGFFSIPFCVIILVFWMLCPIVILFKLRKQKDKLNYCKNRYIFGYYYSEFKPQYYYWEFIRMYIRLGVVMIFSLMKQYIYQVYLFIIFVYSIYIKSLLTFNPFENRKLQRFEQMSNLANIINIILAYVSISFPNYAMIILFEIFHNITIVYIILVVISYKVNSKSHILGRLARWILQKTLSSTMFEQYQQKQTTNFITFIRWKIIQKNLYNIISSRAVQKARRITMSCNKDMDLLTQINSQVQNLIQQSQFSNEQYNGQLLVKQDKFNSKDEVISSQNEYELKSQNQKDFIQDDMILSKDSIVSDAIFPSEREEDFNFQKSVTQSQNTFQGSPVLKPLSYDFQNLYKVKFEDKNETKTDNKKQ